MAGADEKDKERLITDTAPTQELGQETKEKLKSWKNWGQHILDGVVDAFTNPDAVNQVLARHHKKQGKGVKKKKKKVKTKHEILGDSLALKGTLRGFKNAEDYHDYTIPSESPLKRLLKVGRQGKEKAKSFLENLTPSATPRAPGDQSVTSSLTQTPTSAFSLTRSPTMGGLFSATKKPPTNEQLGIIDLEADAVDVFDEDAKRGTRRGVWEYAFLQGNTDSQEVEKDALGNRVVTQAGSLIEWFDAGLRMSPDGKVEHNMTLPEGFSGGGNATFFLEHEPTKIQIWPRRVDFGKVVLGDSITMFHYTHAENFFLLKNLLTGRRIISPTLLFIRIKKDCESRGLKGFRLTRLGPDKYTCIDDALKNLWGSEDFGKSEEQKAEAAKIKAQKKKKAAEEGLEIEEVDEDEEDDMSYIADDGIPMRDCCEYCLAIHMPQQLLKRLKDEVNTGDVWRVRTKTFKNWLRTDAEIIENNFLWDQQKKKDEEDRERRKKLAEERKGIHQTMKHRLSSPGRVSLFSPAAWSPKRGSQLEESPSSLRGSISGFLSNMFSGRSSPQASQRDSARDLALTDKAPEELAAEATRRVTESEVKRKSSSERKSSSSRKSVESSGRTSRTEESVENDGTAAVDSATVPFNQEYNEVPITAPNLSATKIPDVPSDDEYSSSGEGSESEDLSDQDLTQREDGGKASPGKGQKRASFLPGDVEKDSPFQLYLDRCFSLCNISKNTPDKSVLRQGSQVSRQGSQISRQGSQVSKRGSQVETKSEGFKRGFKASK